MNTLTSNIISYSRLFEEFFATLPGQSLFFGIFAVFFFLGLAARFKADLLFVLYAVLYLIVLWTWPEWQGYRFLFPMLPFFVYLYFAMQGIRVTLDKVGGNQKTILQKGALACLLLITILFAYNAGLNAYTNLRGGREMNGPF